MTIFNNNKNNNKMKKLTHWIKTNKTSIAAILFGVLAYLNVEHIVNTPQTVLITVILGALGFAVAKDSNKHSTTEQIAEADARVALLEEDPVVYDQVTESQRLAINTAIKGRDYVCYQVNTINFPIGYWRINPDLTWGYLGTRPPHR